MIDVDKALKEAFALGQAYWQQADSESPRHWRKADETRAKFDALLSQAAALEAAREDAEKWRKCNTTHDIGDGERIECHVIVGVNVYNGKDWLGFEQPTPDEFFKTLDAIDQARGSAE